MNIPCLKRKYGSEKSAHRKLRELRKKRRMHHAEKVETRVYQCKFCFSWHLTSQDYVIEMAGKPS